MSKIKKVILKQDLVIPAGTVFTKGPTFRSWAFRNFEAIIRLYKNKSGIAYLTIIESDLHYERTDGTEIEFMNDLFEIVWE